MRQSPRTRQHVPRRECQRAHLAATRPRRLRYRAQRSGHRPAARCLQEWRGALRGLPWRSPRPGRGEGECARGKTEYKTSCARPRGEGTRGLVKRLPAPSSGAGSLAQGRPKGRPGTQLTGSHSRAKVPGASPGCRILLPRNVPRTPRRPHD